MRLRCLSCGALNSPVAPACDPCGEDLRYAEKVYIDKTEEPSTPPPKRPEPVQSRSPGSEIDEPPTYCDCDPAKRPSGTATACWLCDRPYRPEATFRPNDPQPENERAEDPVHVVAVLPGGLTVSLAPGLLLGREIPGADPALAATLFGRPGVSRVHAWIGHADNQITVLDLGSRNGTWIAGERLQPGNPWRCATAALPVVVYLGGTFSMTIQGELPP